MKRFQILFLKEVFVSDPFFDLVLTKLELESLLILLLVLVFLAVTHNTLLYKKHYNEYQKISKCSINQKKSEESSFLSLPEWEESSEEVTSKSKCIGVNGLWYKVDNFLGVHPGGPIIQNFVGVDCTAAFFAMHRNPEELLVSRKPIARIIFKKRDNTKINQEFLQLYQRYKALGLFNPDSNWILKMLFINLIAFFMAVLSVWNFPQNWFCNGLLIGIFFNLSGFMTHDTGHLSAHKDKSVNKLGMWFFGNVCFGVGGLWWQYEHDIHHGMPNTYDSILGITDLQSNEDVWCQSERILKFFNRFYHPVFIRFQHYLFLPLIMIFGRHGIIFDCFKDEKRIKEWIGLLIHFVWVYLVFSMNDCPWKAYAVASVYQATLALQLISNHYYKDFIEANTNKYQCFPKRQIEVNVNVKCETYWDWYYGGLHFHNEHHVFPKMPRYNLRLISKDLRSFMENNGIVYHEEYFHEIVINIYKHFKKVARIYTKKNK